MKETMDAEVLQLAREAVAALQQPNWAEVAQLGVSSVGLERFTLGCSQAVSLSSCRTRSGIQGLGLEGWIPAFAGMTGGYTGS